MIKDQLMQIVGADYVVADDQLAPWSRDWSGAYQYTPLAVVRPANTQQVSQILRLANETWTAVVPVSGNTGLAGGAEAEGSIQLSLDRMNRILEIRPKARLAIVEAGVILSALHYAADGHDLIFPLTFGARGSAMIGGNLATNAGGSNVLRYGNARDLCLGLELVMHSGEVMDLMSELHKDNSGYNLKHLMIGAEGTLGIITAAVLKLFPAVRSLTTAWVALPSTQAAVELIGQMRSLCGDRLTGFELMSRQSVEFVLRHVAGVSDPFAEEHPWYVLIELSDTQPNAPLNELLEQGLGAAFEQGVAQDAVVAASDAQVRALWALREGISEAQNHEGPSLKHDISVPVSRIPDFIARTDQALQQAFPGVRIVAYGHVGDGNLHYNISKPIGAEDAAFKAQAEAIMHVIYDQTLHYAGSISAEHGLGQSKRLVAQHYKAPLELELMARVKQALDPAGLMNPGKLL